MQAFYAAIDDKGNVAQNILNTLALALPLTQGETKMVTIHLMQANGLPYLIPGTISTAVAKIFSSINGSSISKSLAASTLTLVTTTINSVVYTTGFRFQLLAADTLSMAANNSGLPMICTLVDSTANTFEFDFQSMFNVSVPAVLT